MPSPTWALAARLSPILIAACTSMTASGGSSTGSGLPADASVPTGVLVAGCPATLPSDGGSCSLPGELDCEYGTDWNPMCNTIADCWRGGPLNATWQLEAPASGANSPCPTPLTLSPSCPPSLPTADSACGAEAMGILCPYPPALCGCIQEGDGPAPDASGSWVCSNAGTGCPADRPRIGSACEATTQNDYCAYAVCGIGGVTACSNGVWMEGVLISHCE